MTKEEKRLGYAACEPEPSQEDEYEQKLRDDMIKDMNTMKDYIEEYFHKINYDRVLEAINNLNEELGGVLE